MLKELRQLSTSVVTENPWWQYRLDSYEQPDGNTGVFHYVHTPGSVFVIPITARGKLVFVKQYRYLNRRESIEFCGGGIKPSLGIEGSAIAELREETGLECAKLTPIGAFNPMNGVTDELCHVFVATDLKPLGARPDTSEEFELLERSIADCTELIREGTLWDGMTLAALTMLRAQKPELLNP
jgi:ADP-ribose pyrophosphatase